jgi:hypothetical protein
MHAPAEALACCQPCVQVLIYMRYLNMATYTAVTQFVACVKFPSKQQSVLAEGVVGLLEVLDIDTAGLACATTDGALQGHLTGFLGQLRTKVSPYILGVHCAAHRTALLFGDVAHLAELQLVDDILISVHALFSKSPKRQQQWESFASKYGITALKFPLFVKSRWLSRTGCLRVLLTNLPVLMKFLRIVSDVSADKKWQAAAQAVLEKLDNKLNLLTLHATSDLLQPLEVLNLKFQSDDLLPQHVPEAIDACCTALEPLLLQPLLNGERTKAFLAELRDGTWSTSRSKFPITLSIDCADTDDAQVDAFVVKVGKAVVAGIKERFDKKDTDLLSAFKALDPVHYPDTFTADSKKKLFVKEMKLLVGNFAGNPPKKPSGIFNLSTKDELNHLFAEFGRVS